MSKKALLIRPGALGDMIILTPVLSELKKQGYYVLVHTGPRGEIILKNNPNVDEIIPYEYENKENPKALEQFEALKNKIKPDYYKDFCESIEVNVALHPKSPIYIYPKWMRITRGNRNYYDATLEWAGLNARGLKPELFVTEQEEQQVREYLTKKELYILWCLSGSGKNKTYPWTEYIMGEVLKNYDNIHFITVGNTLCQLLETLKDKNITNLSGEINFRETLILTKLVNLVISPDTGVLHASGAFKTPKIGILGHTTKENITKYFDNDYSLEADTEEAECSPCFRLIYDHKIQCPIDNLTGAAWCMHHGQPAHRLYNQIVKVLDEQYGIRPKNGFKEGTGIPEAVSHMR